MKNYVFIGFNGLFGDYADIVHANGGRLIKVVVNLPLETVSAGRTFADRLASHQRWRERAGIEDQLEIEELQHFRPTAEDHHILACRGAAVKPLRDYLVQKLGIFLEPLVHPETIISPTVELPEGIIIHSRVHIGADVQLGAYASIKTGCYVGHDSVIGAYADLSPDVSLASGVIIEDHAQLGINCTVINQVRIGRDSFVAAGAVVTTDVAPLTMVAGVPAVVKKVLPARAVPATVRGLE